MTDILIIEDNTELANLLKDFLISDGYTTEVFNTGEDGMAHFNSHGAKLVILDVMLPGMDGLAVCEEIRRNSIAPIIIVSAKTEKDDKLSGLLLGADDYIEKPYDIDILLAKIKGIFKRRYSSDTIVDGNIKVDKFKRIVCKDNKPLNMTQKEFELLLLLLENADKTLEKDYIFNKVWGYDSFSEQQTLTVHIKWLRKKIEDDPQKPTKIVTVWGRGYRYVTRGEEAEKI